MTSILKNIERIMYVLEVEANRASTNVEQKELLMKLQLLEEILND